MSKVVDALEAIQAAKDGDTLLVGGFGLVGVPLTLLHALATAGVKDLTVISNSLGEPGIGLGMLLRRGRLRRAVGSFFTNNPEVIAAISRGELEADLLPQGTLAEAIRAGGAGIAGFYTPTAAGTLLAEGHETRVFEGRPHVLQMALTGELSLIRAHVADELGNLIYAKTARNFNPVMATAGRYVIAEVDRVVPVGHLDPELVETPHTYVDAIVIASPLACEVETADVR